MKAAYVVLGMHRSGTSSVAGALALLGATPPAHLMGPKDDNPSGFWESEKIAEFNDEIFHSVGSSWRDWGPLDPSVFSGPHGNHFKTASRWLIHSEFGGADTIVLKDPRISRLYPFWRSALVDTGYSPIIVTPVRAPDEVVASLVARNGMPAPLAMRLWLSHVIEAEWASRGQPRHIMLWTDFMQSWRDQVQQIMNLGGPALLPSSAEAKVDAFLDQGLRRQRSGTAETDLPELVLRTIRALRALAQAPNEAEHLGELDLIRQDFALARRLFYDGPHG